ATLLHRGEFVVTVEIGPPKSASVESVRKKAKTLVGYCDAANVTDNQAAIVRLSAWAGSLVLVEEGLEPIMQMTTRDRNIMAIQSDLLGAWALGVRNVLALSGDPIKIGNHPMCKPVSEIDSTGLVRLLAGMRDTAKLFNGEEIDPAPRYFIGSAVNPTLDSSDKVRQKVDSGADFFQSNIVYDLRAFRRWFEPLRDEGLFERVPLLVGVTPPKSEKMLRHVKDNIPGVNVPEEVLSRMAGKQGDRAAEEGKAIAAEVIQALKGIEGVRGVHIMAIAWEEIVPEIVEAAGLTPRPRV
ncbi:MAG: 5,10-methylenetetrahydrofolate reductase, partial [Acidimicrobiia bacterium]